MVNTNLVGAWRGLSFCISNKLQLMLLLLVDRPHSEEQKSSSVTLAMTTQ